MSGEIPTEGVWHVYTETSHHVLDLDEMVATRIPGEGDGPESDGWEPPPTSDLRRDRHAVPLLRVLELEVGQRGIWMLQVRHDSIPTVRYTTIIRRLEREERA